MAKSLTATMAGVLAKDGFWNLDSKLPIEDWKGSPREAITLENALNMATGLEWVEDYGTVSPATKMLYSSNNMGERAASYPLEFEPGEFWEYSSGTTNILSYVMTEAFDSQAEYLAFPYERIFKPLGAETFVLETDASDHFVGSSYGYASARDWAKLGQLFLNKGNMYGEQIIDTAWVEFCSTPLPESENIYGGHFWFPHARGQEGYRPNDYAMDGFQGQTVSIHPEDEMVIVRLGVMYEESDFDFGNWVKEIREVLDQE
jgi:CubicO group peptidase (beta-lactamase class C family)